MSELHKPVTPGPWKAAHVPDGPDGYWDVYVPDDLERGFVAEVYLHPSDAAAIADLWRWVERAERYEAALWEITRQARRHTHSSARIAAAVDELRLIATEALREEGR